MEFKIYDIVPVSKPRQTQRSKWKQTPQDSKYYAFKDHIRFSGTTLPEFGYHVIFALPMPQNWSEKRKSETVFTPYKKTPDKDNLEKALLDSIFKNDSHIWDGRVTKVWGYSGKIIIITGIDVSWIKKFLEEIL